MFTAHHAVLSSLYPWPVATTHMADYDTTPFPADYLVHEAVNVYSRVADASLLLVYDTCMDSLTEDGRGWLSERGETWIIPKPWILHTWLSTRWTTTPPSTLHGLSTTQPTYLQLGLGLISVQGSPVAQDGQRSHHTNERAPPPASTHPGGGIEGSVSSVNNNVGKLSQRLDTAEEEMRGSVCETPALSQTLQEPLERMESLERLAEVLRGDVMKATSLANRSSANSMTSADPSERSPLVSSPPFHCTRHNHSTQWPLDRCHISTVFSTRTSPCLMVSSLVASFRHQISQLAPPITTIGYSIALFTVCHSSNSPFPDRIRYPQQRTSVLSSPLEPSKTTSTSHSRLLKLSIYLIFILYDRCRSHAVIEVRLLRDSVHRIDINTAG
ncbi:hypothetical protein BKA70DRAFT_1237488 [Coprinopsis sp. MPI-PUGE-AT-0042]|nr:hypothetical protein BKA70DRAFT_1237488 [Coprinopsis sp. MPI-PUGE-AT-0042]